MSACNPECSGDRQALLCEIIHTGKVPDPAAIAECIHDKIHRPRQVQRIRVQKRNPSGSSVGSSSTLHMPGSSLGTGLNPANVPALQMRT
jgi:hypothetical protein